MPQANALPSEHISAMCQEIVRKQHDDAVRYGAKFNPVVSAQIAATRYIIDNHIVFAETNTLAHKG